LAVVVPGLNFGGGMEGAKVQKVHTFATKLAKHSVKRWETTGGNAPFAIPWIRHW